MNLVLLHLQKILKKTSPNSVFLSPFVPMASSSGWHHAAAARPAWEEESD